MNALVTVEWLNSNLGDDGLILLDTSMKSTMDGNPSPYQNGTIPGARYFNLKDNFSDQESAFPNTMPSADQFESECQKLGIHQSSKIVVFDNKGIYSSPRVWWMFKVMGHDSISVLDGGLPEWIKNDFPVEDKVETRYPLGNFRVDFKVHWLKSYHEVLNNVTSPTFDVIDARSEGRFNGTANEPRKDLKSGNIPNSINIPYTSVLRDGKLKSELELKSIFEEKCQDAKDLVFSCGSGLTACIVMLASEVAFKSSQLLFDGSWTEWAIRQNLKNES